MGRSKPFIPLSSSFHLSTSFRPGLTLKQGGVLGHLSFILLTFTALSFLPVPGNGARHRCYVCLPDDKSTSIARDVQALFPDQRIPDCSSFPNITDDAVEVAQEYQFDCPQEFFGCSLRYGRYPGIPESRTCTPRHNRNCYSVNNVVLCYCAQPLCNRDRVTAQSQGPEFPPERETVRNSRYFSEVETDDEDLINLDRPAVHRQHATLAQVHSHDDLGGDGDEGSGQFDDSEYGDEEDEEGNINESTVTPNMTQGHHDHNVVDIPTRDNDTHHMQQSNEDHDHPSHNDPTYPYSDEELAHDEVNASRSSESEGERDASTTGQGGAITMIALNLSNILLISLSAILVNLRKS